MGIRMSYIYKVLFINYSIYIYGALGRDAHFS